MSRSDPPKGFSLADFVATFVALEEDGDAIPVLGDDDAMSVLAAWRKTDQTWRPPKAKMPVITTRNHAAVWGWLCSGWLMDGIVVDIVRGTGLSPYVVRNKLAMLIAARLIYPDGHMSKSAKTALQLHVAKKLGIKPKRKKDPAGAAGEGGEPTN